jgi:hypothetical protein
MIVSSDVCRSYPDLVSIGALHSFIWSEEPRPQGLLARPRLSGKDGPKAVWSTRRPIKLAIPGFRLGRCGRHDGADAALS